MQKPLSRIDFDTPPPPAVHFRLRGGRRRALRSAEIVTSSPLDYFGKAQSMKKLLLLALITGGMALSAGCYTPAYTPSERHAQIARNWDFEGKQATDDWDTVLLFRPASHLTIWNVR